MTGEFDPAFDLAFDLGRAVPWGRNRVEYLAFFDLLGLEPGTRILDCGSGPSSFNAEMTALGFPVVSADPLYAYSKAAIARRIAEARASIMARVKDEAVRFVWDDYGSPEGLERTRLSAMKFFLEDYEEGRAEGRYVDACLPELPFDDGAFDLALSSHFLLLYSDQHGLGNVAGRRGGADLSPARHGGRALGAPRTAHRRTPGRRLQVRNPPRRLRVPEGRQRNAADIQELAWT